MGTEHFTLLIGCWLSPYLCRWIRGPPGSSVVHPGIVSSDSFRCCAQCTKPVPKTGSPTCLTKYEGLGWRLEDVVPDFRKLVVSKVFYFHPGSLGKWCNLRHIFHMGWNHQLVFFEAKIFILWIPLNWFGPLLQEQVEDHLIRPKWFWKVMMQDYLGHDCSMIIENMRGNTFGCEMKDQQCNLIFQNHHASYKFWPNLSLHKHFIVSLCFSTKQHHVCCTKGPTSTLNGNFVA